MKILYVTTISGTMVFFYEHFKMLLLEGNTIELACNCETQINQKILELGFKTHNIPFSRSPFSKSNLVAYKQLKALISKNNYDIVHCHTPNAAAITRFVCKNLRKKGLKVYYTAHGFHFYSGAPLKNWFIYYPIEWLCSHFTDVLITINTEDYKLAHKRMKAKSIVYVPGVGIDLNKFETVEIDKSAKRIELGIPENAKLFFSVGELNDNKNHETAIRAIAGTDAYYVIAGDGNKRESLQKLIDDLKVSDRIKLLGYRFDVAEIYAASDFFLFPSFREGLPVSVMEAMASGLPVACSKIRGNTDLVDKNGGVLFDPYSVDDCKLAIEKLMNINNKEEMGNYNKNKIKGFEIGLVLKEIKRLYQMYSNK